VEVDGFDADGTRRAFPYEGWWEARCPRCKRSVSVDNGTLAQEELPL